MTSHYSNFYILNLKNIGLFDQVDKVQKWRICTLDVEEGNHFKNAIDNLNKNHQKIVPGIKLQISLSKEITNKYSDSLEKII